MAPEDPSKFQERLIVEQLRTKAKEENFILRNIWVDYSNKTLEGLRTIQFTLATFLFTFSSPIFVATKLLNDTEKILFFLAWIFLLLSIFMGLLDIVLDIKEFGKAAELTHEREAVFAKAFMDIDEYSKAVEKADNIARSGVNSSTNLLVAGQSLLMVIGFCLILSAAGLILFK